MSGSVKGQGKRHTEFGCFFLIKSLKVSINVFISSSVNFGGSAGSAGTSSVGSTSSCSGISWESVSWGSSMKK